MDRKEYYRAWTEANRERVFLQHRAYREAHKEEITARKQAYAKEHAEEIKAKKKAYYQANKEHFAQSGRERYLRNPQKHIDNARRWRLAHPEETREAVKRSMQKNGAKYRHARTVLEEVRRSRKANLPHTLTPTQWQAIKDTYKHCCAYCGKHSKRLCQDHIIPLSKGGGYTLGNIVPACSHCNSKKGDRPIPEGTTLKLLML